MNLLIAYEVGFVLANTLALLAVLLGGELPQPAWFSLVVPAASSLLREQTRDIPRWLGTALAGAALLYAGFWVIQQGLAFAALAGATGLVGLLSARLLSRASLDDDLQALLLSLLLVFTGSVLHAQVSYGLIFVLYALAIVWALLARQLMVAAEAEAARAGGERLEHSLRRRDVVTPTFFAVVTVVSVAVLSSTLALFFVFPRMGLGSLSTLAQRRDLLPGSVSLAGAPRASLGGGRVVARVVGLSRQDFDHGLYLRGPVYDRLERTGFSRTSMLDLMNKGEHALGRWGDLRRYEVYLEPVAQDALFSLGWVARARAQVGGDANPSVRLPMRQLTGAGELRAAAVLSGPLRYEVIGTLSQVLRGKALPVGVEDGPGRSANSSSQAQSLQHFLQLPKGLDERILGLARRVSAGTGAGVGADTGAGADADADARGDSVPNANTDPLVQAARVRQFLLQNFDYTLSQPNAGKADPVASFLFDDRRGHCEYFATAYATLLRLLDIPARVVGGYQGGAWEPDGRMALFTSAHAHAWVEWHHPQYGWLVDDATPPSPPPVLTGLAAWLVRAQRFWDDTVVDYSYGHQLALLQEGRDWFRGLGNGGSWWGRGGDDARGGTACLGSCGLCPGGFGARC